MRAAKPLISLLASAVALPLFSVSSICISGYASGSAIYFARVLIRQIRKINLRSVYTFGKSLKPFPKEPGGLRVSVADINGDFQPEVIVGAGPGGTPRVTVYNLNTQTGAMTKPAILNFFAFDATSKIGVNLGGGAYFNRDFIQDLVVAGGKNSAQIKVFNSSDQTLIYNFSAFADAPKGGVNVALGRFNNDPVADIVVAAGSGSSPRVAIFNGQTGAQLTSAIGSFFAYDSTFTGGVNISAADINNDGTSDVVVAPQKGVQAVRVLNGIDASLVREFFPYGSGFKGGVSVTTGDVNGDGLSDIICSPLSGKQPVKLFDSASGNEVTSFYPFGKSWSGGAFAYQF